MTSLYNALKSGYKNKESQSKKLKQDGYIRDDALSSGNHQAYYNPTTKKLQFNVTGTHNLADVVTDGIFALGGLKSTNRYKEADKMLKIAKKKYNVKSADVTGHSLGGAVAGLISSKNDHVTTLDKAATFGSRIRSNENAYRSLGDPFSILNSRSKRMQTLNNPNLSLINPLKNHDIDNIKDSNIFV
jgi:hypothetical protein